MNTSDQNFSVGGVQIHLELYDPKSEKTYKHKVTQGRVSGSEYDGEINIYDKEGNSLGDFPIFEFAGFSPQLITKVERKYRMLIIHVKIPSNFFYAPRLSDWDMTFTISGSAEKLKVILRAIASRLERDGNPHNLDMSNWH